MTWKTLPLPEALEFREGPGIMAVDFHDHGIPLIRLAGLKSGADLLEGCNYLDPNMVSEKWAHFQVKEGDVLLSTSASLGEVAVVGSQHVGAVPYTGIIAFRPRSPEVDQRFIRYLLTAPSFQEQIEAMGAGSVMRHFGPMHLRQMTVTFPKVSQQHAIADVLGALDDKIATNTALARTADNLVRAEFDWIDSIANQHRRLSELVTFPRVGTDPAAAGSSAYVGLEHVPRRLMWLTEWGSSSEVSSTKSKFQKADVLFGKLRPYFHKVASAPTAGICSTDIIVCRATDPALRGFCLAALSSDSVIKQVAAASEGTRMPRTSWQTLSAVQVPWPGDATTDEFSFRTDQLRSAVEAHLAENRTLGELRDTLLPKLMSGELTVREAEGLAEDATGRAAP